MNEKKERLNRKVELQLIAEIKEKGWDTEKRIEALKELSQCDIGVLNFGYENEITVNITWGPLGWIVTRKKYYL